MIQVELVRAWPRRCETVVVKLADDASVDDAFAASGWKLDEPFIGLAIFGVKATPATCLRDGDRIELLRGLQIDPKQARLRRAQRSGRPPVT